MSRNTESAHNLQKERRNCITQEYSAKTLWDLYAEEDKMMQTKELKDKSPKQKLKAESKEKAEEAKEEFVRRKSCSSYNWSGGISKFELKTMHIPFVIVRPRRIELENTSLKVPLSKNGEHRGSLLKRVVNVQINTRMRGNSLERQKSTTPGLKKTLFHAMSKDSDRSASLKSPDNSPTKHNGTYRSFDKSIEIKTGISQIQGNEAADQSSRTNENLDVTWKSRIERDKSGKSSIVKEKHQQQNNATALQRKPSSVYSLNSSMSDFKTVMWQAMADTIKSHETKNKSPKLTKKLHIKSLEEDSYHNGLNKIGIGHQIATFISAKDGQKVRIPSSDALIRSKIIPKTANGSPTHSGRGRESSKQANREEQIKKLYLSHRSQSSSMDVPSLFSSHFSTPFAGKASSQINSATQTLRPKTQNSQFQLQFANSDFTQSNQESLRRKGSLPELATPKTTLSQPIVLKKTTSKKSKKSIKIQTEKLLSTINHTNMKELLKESNQKLLKSARTPLIKNISTLIGAFESSITGYERRKQEFELRRINAIKALPQKPK